jgi:hypothetical protein
MQTPLIKISKQNHAKKYDPHIIPFHVNEIHKHIKSVLDHVVLVVDVGGKLKSGVAVQCGYLSYLPSTRGCLVITGTGT